MVQGVFIKKTVAGYQELEDLVTNNEARVFLQRNEQFIKVLTQDQEQKYIKNFGSEPPMFPILLLEELKSQLKGTTGIKWFSCYIRPKFKKELRSAVKDDPANIYLEATSIFGNEYGGELATAPFGSYYIIGPEPSETRLWSSEISWSKAKNSWIVK